VARGRLVDAGVAQGLLDAALDRVFVEMMAAPDARPRIARRLSRREDVLPAGLEVGARVFAMKRMRKLDAAEAACAGGAMCVTDLVELAAQRR
jgi:hypothetical protein